MADGQVTRGSEIVKPNVRKVRRLGEGKVIGGFAGGGWQLCIEHSSYENYERLYLLPPLLCALGDRTGNSFTVQVLQQTHSLYLKGWRSCSTHILVRIK